ncbi:hypothetical protein J7E69_19185 [Rhodococcus enclensis]|nr:hypothetical protein [Rhodococcus qingshengii]
MTCPFCFDMRALTALTAGLVFTRPGDRGVCVDALAGADFLHLVYTKARQSAGGQGSIHGLDKMPASGIHGSRPKQ